MTKTYSAEPLGEIQRAAFRAELETYITKARFVVAKWAKRLESDPLAAFAWARDAKSAAAEIELAKAVMRRIDGDAAYSPAQFAADRLDKIEQVSGELAISCGDADVLAARIRALRTAKDWVSTMGWIAGLSDEAAEQLAVKP